MFLQQPDLPADRAMGDVQLFGRLTDAVQAGSGFESTKCVQRGKVVAHMICEFS
ncbi:hypothetical protein D3C87_2177390 [compost metagenome]